MEQYIVSARKYRPTTFKSVVGQQALASTLKNAIASDRLAHAYLFCGSRGVGKTSCARIFAKTINCTSRTPDGEACNQCDSCRQFNENRSLNIIELDAASHNGVEDIKNIIDQVMVPPTEGKYRVFIIDEVHMLSNSAFNSFLKTLEEPPSYVIFILATTEKHKIIPTILSRCQIYDFNRISISDMVSHMLHVAQSEGIEADPAALNIIARKADGAMRDALSIFDQVAASGNGTINYQATVENLNVLDHSYYTRLVESFVKQDVASALLIYKEIRDKGFDSQFFINGLGMYFRDLMVASNPATLTLLDVPDDIKSEMAQRAAGLHPTFLYRAMDLCNDADFNFRQASNKQFLIELTLIKLCQLLSPSSDESGSGEGQLKPLAASPDTRNPQSSSTTNTSSQPTSGQHPTPRQTIATAHAAPHNPTPTAHTTQAYVPGGLSLKRNTATTPKPQVEAMPIPQPQIQAPSQQNEDKRQKSFGDNDFSQAWRSLIASLAGEPILANTLSNASPERTGSQSIVIHTSKGMQAEKIRDELKRISAFLCNELENDCITFEVDETEKELEPAFWQENKVLEYMIEKHPQLVEMMKKYKMRLQ